MVTGGYDGIILPLQTRPHVDSSSNAQLSEPHVLSLHQSFSVSVILSGHCKSQMEMILLFLMFCSHFEILEGSSLLSLFVEGKGNAVSLIVGNI